MCGIIGYLGEDQALPLLLGGLNRLEYRGYDSAGVALVDHDGQVTVRKKVGRVATLVESLTADPLQASTVGIAHTRWATHGVPSDANAHPHRSCDGNIAVVHNGTIDNHRALRKILEAKGHRFTSETDTEVLAHLIEQFVHEGDSLRTAVQNMHVLVHGAYGILVVSGYQPDQLIAVRYGSPLLVGIAERGTFVASDATAFREHTDQALALEDGEMVIAHRHRPLEHRTLTNEIVSRSVETISWSLEEISKGGSPHFMLKEIMEQPEALENVLRGRLVGETGSVQLGGVAKIEEFLRAGFRRILITACGTSWHAGLIGERMLEKLLRIPVKVVYASELVTGYTPVDRETLVIAISQSGETKDTIDAVKKCQAAGATVWNICNVVGSSLTRVADSGTFLYVGPEIGVASTKAFTAQVVALALFASMLTELRGCPWVTDDNRQAIADALRKLPAQAAQVVRDSDHVLAIAGQFFRHGNALFLGRGYNFPTALEGALKLKEISYIHAEGYPSGEMKHGPIALIDRNMPVIVIAPRESEDVATTDRVFGNLEEAAARGARVILIASEGDPRPEELRQSKLVERILYLPHTLAMFTPILAGIYLQLLAYHIAVLRGCDVDKPRNLAKSVTVV